MRIPIILSMFFVVQITNAGEAIDDLRAGGFSVNSVTPIFSQMVMLAYPRNFVLAFESGKGSNYVQEHVLKGESVDKWTQMISLTGTKGAASIPQLTPAAVLQQVAAGFQQKCPDTFAAKALGKVDIGGGEGFAALIGCGTFASQSPYGETALMIAVKGSADVYTIQWAEHGAPTSLPPVLDEVKWKARFQQLLPIRVCDRVPNEAPPYPSCINQSAGK